MFSKVIVFIIIFSVILIILLWIFYCWKKLARPSRQPTELIRRLSQSISRSGNSCRHEITVNGTTTLSDLSDHPPTYAEAQLVGPPPSYDDAVRDPQNALCS